MDIEELLAYAKKLAVEIGDHLAVTQATNGDETSLKDDNTIQTTADLWASNEYTRRIKQKYPEHIVLTEEGTWDVQLQNGTYYWIIDPLDGTTNYANGSPIFGTSVAVYTGSEPVCGVLYMPATKKLLTSHDGQLTKKRKINHELSKHEVVLDRGDLRAGKDIDEFQRITNSLIINTRTIRMFGSATYSLMAILEGYDCFIGCRMKLYDVAAGVAIAKNAGLSVTDFNGQEWSGSMPKCDLLITSKEHAKDYVAIFKGIY